MKLGAVTRMVHIAAFAAFTFAVFACTIGLAQIGFAKDANESKSANTTPEKTPRRMSFSPDPAPIRSHVQWEIALLYRKGKVEVTSVRKVRFAKPIATVRRMGRFAVELLSGEQVVERVRFDFPMLAAEPAKTTTNDKSEYFSPPRFQDKATSTYRLMVPDTERASRLRVIDRATGQHITLRWPPRTALAAKPPPTTAQTEPAAPLTPPAATQSQPSTAPTTTRSRPTTPPTTKRTQPAAAPTSR